MVQNAPRLECQKLCIEMKQAGAWEISSWHFYILLKQHLEDKVLFPHYFSCLSTFYTKTRQLGSIKALYVYRSRTERDYDLFLTSIDLIGPSSRLCFPCICNKVCGRFRVFFVVTWRLHFWVSLRALCLLHFWHSNCQSHVLDCWFFVAPWWHFNMKEEGFTWCRPGHILYVDDMNLHLLQHIDNVRSIMHMPMHVACTFENIDVPWSRFFKDECPWMPEKAPTALRSKVESHGTLMWRIHYETPTFCT